MKMIKSKVFALSLLCVAGSALQAMENDELTFTNDTRQKAHISIRVQGNDQYGSFKRSIKSYDLQPDEILHFKKADIPSEFTYDGKSLIDYFWGAVSFDNGKGAEWKAFPPRHLIITFDDTTAKYKVEEK